MRWRCVWLCFLALSVASVIDVQARLVRNHVSSICSTWGREHFKTFDGDVYQFPGMCEYNLVSDCHESYQEFSVHMKRKDKDGNPTVSHVVVTINDLLFYLTKDMITVNDLPVKTPYYNGGVQLENNAVYIKLQSKVGITVMWNGDDAVMVELDADYVNRTCGLCGDFNGVSVHNEFIHNGRKISPIEFGNKQKVHRPNDDCEDPFEEEDESLEAVLDSCKEFQTTCNQMLHSEPWSSCTKLINPEPYIQACVQDMCGCANSTNYFCVCSTLSEFSRQCSHAGGQPPNWRTPQFCAKQCPYNMIYEESGSPCMDTCALLDTSSLCEDHKIDGCFCPPGTVFDDISMRGCIAQSECQCKHNKIYNSGEVYRQDREECTCVEGRWACKSLQTPATCAVEEGSHVTTFDGKTYIFHGDCYYTLAKVESKDHASPKFTILVQLVPCANQKFDTCIKSLKILLNNDRNNVLMFTSDGTVKQNMQTISLPYHSGDINIFHASSFHILLQTSYGLQIQIQHVPVMQVYVSLEQSYRAKTRGLCGNYNMVLSDDMKTPQGIVEGTAVMFSNSWKANLMCRDREERLEDPCSLSVENEWYAKHWCALLLSPDSNFAQCRSVVDPEMYYKRCTYASCNCEKSEDCLCAVFSSYARACASKGVFLTDWRENVCDKYTRSCPASQIFSYKHQRCQLTCRSLGTMQQSCISDFLPVDGCSCSEGLYLNENGICVPMAKCPCYHNDVYVKSGKSISIKEEHCVCTNGMLHCHSWRARSSTCPIPKVFFNCSAAGTGELGLHCARTCLNLDSDDCDSTECESGCRCPGGLLDDGKGSCVKEKECPCQHDGHIYAPGSQIPDQCNICTCKSGRWECSNKKCPGTCIIYGSGHYNSFDQRTYGFQGHCAYVAMKNNCGNKTVQDNFGVITENVPCGSTGTTCSKTVRIQLGRMEVKLSKGKYEEADLGHGAEIQYKIRKVGLYVVIESAIGLVVMWDGKTTVRIMLEPQHSGEVCGLCGDFDGDGENDFTTQGQLAVSNLLEFANSWKVSSQCPDVDMNADPCGIRPNRHHWAKMMCSIITGNTFKECHNKVAPLPYYENCVKDSCACDSGGDCECFCSAVAAYAQACNEASVCVAWRTPEICPVFCDYYNNPDECKWHYNPCHKPCYKTCLNPEEICSESLPNLEGCYPVCPEDKPIFDEETGFCVEECSGCFYNNTRYEEDEVIYNVTDSLGMCYYAICRNTTVIFENETCPTTPPIETTTTTQEPTTTTQSTTPPIETTTTTQEPTTTTQSTTPPIETTTTTQEPPTTTKSTTPPTTTTQEPTTTTKSTTPPIETTTSCITTCEWSEWYDVHSPLEDKSDWETYENIINSNKTICKNPKEIDCRSTDYPDKDFNDFVSQTGQVVSCDVGNGLICRQEDQIRPPRKCFNYKIRVCCEVLCSTTTLSTPSTTPPTTTTTEKPTTTTKSTIQPTEPTTTTQVPPTTTKSTTPPTTTTQEPTTTTKSTTPPIETTTTTQEPTTTTQSTTPPIDTTTTTQEPTTTTQSTTPPIDTTTTTQEPDRTTKSTTPPIETTTTTQEPTTTTQSTTPLIETTTTTQEPTTTTKSTTPPIETTTTTQEPTTTTQSTTPPIETTTTTQEPTTTTQSTTPPIDTTTTTQEPTTTTQSTTPPIDTTTTTQEPDTTTKSTTPPIETTTTTQEPTTTTQSTTPLIETTTTTQEPTTTTKSTTPPIETTTTTQEPTTTTQSTTPPIETTTTTQEPTTTTQSTTPPIDTTTTTQEPTTTTQSTTPPIDTTTTTQEPDRTTKSTTPPIETTTTTQEPTTTTQSTTPLIETTTTTQEPTTTTQSTTPPIETTTTTQEPTTTTKSTTPPIETTTTTQEPPTTTKSTTPPIETTTTTQVPTTTTQSTTPPIETTTSCITTCEWSEWYDVHSPLEDKSDWETYENIINSNKTICKNPKEIDCRSTDYPDKDFNDFVSQTGQVVSCDVGNGLICRQEDQIRPPRKCFNYKIRVCCEVLCSTTTLSTPSTTPPTTTTTTTEKPTTTTKSTIQPTEPTTTTQEPPTTTKSTTPPTTTTQEPTTTTKSTIPPIETTTTTQEPTTTTQSTTPPIETTTTTQEPTTTTQSTTPPIDTTTTTQEPDRSTKSTTPPIETTTTTQEPPTTTKSTTPPTTTTQEPTTTTQSTTPPIETTTTTQEPTTTTQSTTTTQEPTTTTQSTTPPIETTTTTQEPTTTTKSTTPPIETTTTTQEPTTTTQSTTPPIETTTTTQEPTTTTQSTTPPIETTTTTQEPTTTTQSTTPPTTTTQEPPTTTKSTTPPTTTTQEPPTTTKSTTPPTTTTQEPPTTTKSTTPATTTTQEPTTTTQSTTPPIETTTTTQEPTTTTQSTTPPIETTTTTQEPTTTTKSTTPPIETTTTTQEPTTTTQSTTPPIETTTTTQEPTTTTQSTTPPIETTTTTQEPTTTTQSTTPPIETTTTTQEPTTTTQSTTPPTTTTQEPPTTTKSTTPPTTTTQEPTTTTQSTTPPIETTTTTQEPTTTTQSTTPPIETTTTTQEPTTTTQSTTPPIETTTTTQEPTTTTKSTTPPIETTTTTQEPTTTTQSTTPPIETTTTTQEPTTTTQSTTPPIETTTTTQEPTTTTQSTTPPTTTTQEPPTTTKSTTPPTTTTQEPPTTTKSTTPPTTTTQEPTTTTQSTTPPIETTTTTQEPTTTTQSTTPPTEPTTTTEEPTTVSTTLTTFESPVTGPTLPTSVPPSTGSLISATTTCFCIVNGKHYSPGDVIFDMEHIGSGVCLTMICSDVCEIHNKTLRCSTTTIPRPIPTIPGIVCPEWDVVQNETFLLCNCTMARCIENNTIEIIPYECPPLENITCTNGKKPVLVYDEYHCCQHYACDCVCEGWGDPHYITFDGFYYSYQGNCTYVLMEEILPKHNLNIYIDNVYCDPTEDVSCPRSIIISYQSEVVALINHNLLGAAQLEALKNGVRLKLPYSHQGVKILDSGINLVLEIPRLKVVVTFGITGFSVTLPNQYFGGNTQGHCGTCNNNQADDCMLPGGKLVENCAVMADYWPAKHIYQPNCHIPSVLPTNIPGPPPTFTSCIPDSICHMLKGSLFEACHPFVSPDNFYQGCVFDSCHVSNPAVECTSLQAYAAACAQAGVCLHWRNHTRLCVSDCPSNKVYKPCGPAEQPSCEDNPNEPTMNYTTEGCFCPDGMKLFNKESGVCVDKCGCLDPEGIPREFNERFEYKCQNCICEESTKTVTCKPKPCPTPPIANCAGPGFVLVNQTNPSDSCCSAFVCQCQSNTCPVYNMNCPVGYMPVVSVPEGKCCPERTCEPKRVCVHKDTEYQPGSSVPGPPCQDCACTNEVDTGSGLFKINCEFQKCQENCDLGYKYLETDSDECCGKCVQTHCVVSVNDTKNLLNPGDTWSPPENKCQHYTCIKVGDTLTTFNSHIVCPPFQQSNCQPGTIQSAANGCCKICVEREKACKVVSMKMHVTHNSCQSHQEVDMPYCEGSCNTFTKYSEAAAAMQHSCSCCRETRSSSRTVDLHCLNGDVVPYSYTHVEECGCGHTDCTRAAVQPARRRRSSTLV
ncbi:mucin-2-like [Cebidichthys violaceus]|uniref:mucin-2-like n=1 Tax=Cebidichthys violaceus TaxID=271503 RepID=UPI0035CA6447